MNPTSFKYELGLEARDPISEFEGIIVSRVNYLFGCAQYGIAPKKTADGQIPSTQYFDEARIEILGPGVYKSDEKQVMDFDKIFIHTAGQEVKDKVTGFKGIITYRIEFLYGCNQYGLTPQVDADGKTRESEQFDEGRIQVLSSGINPREVQAPKRGGVNRDAPPR